MRIPYKKAIGQNVKSGRPSIGKKPGESELKKLYVKEARSIRKIAEILGCSKDMVYRSLKEYDIDRRPGFNRSKLMSYDLSYLKREIRNKGYEKLSAELEVDLSTLRKHIKKRMSSQG